ncbi:hypothetical protein [Paenibacillus polymyxa]|uniref:hypothetical protein n=1 Tax=Paenibacillus polymyxa TaxID=1406 RepID=UPI00237887A5|nr:hypothetical protein [Paenibacillus polymyxa]WDM23112.1 hypothetical protein J4I02_06030 [Paenibacillus polymyxa]
MKKIKGDVWIILKKKFIASMTAVLLLTGGVSAALADHGIEPTAENWQSFDLSVPGYNGSNTTSNQTKTTTGALAGLKLESSNGETLDVRTYSSAGNGSWKRSVTGGNTYQLDSPQEKKKNVALEFSTDILDGDTPVNGTWRSN